MQFVKTCLTCGEAPQPVAANRLFSQCFTTVFCQVLTGAGQASMVFIMTGPNPICGICRRIIS